MIIKQRFLYLLFFVNFFIIFDTSAMEQKPTWQERAQQWKKRKSDQWTNLKSGVSNYFGQSWENAKNVAAQDWEKLKKSTSPAISPYDKNQLEQEIKNDKLERDKYIDNMDQYKKLEDTFKERQALYISKYKEGKQEEELTEQTNLPHDEKELTVKTYWPYDEKELAQQIDWLNGKIDLVNAIYAKDREKYDRLNAKIEKNKQLKRANNDWENLGWSTKVNRYLQSAGTGIKNYLHGAFSYKQPVQKTAQEQLDTQALQERLNKNAFKKGKQFGGSYNEE